MKLHSHEGEGKSKRNQLADDDNGSLSLSKLYGFRKDKTASFFIVYPNFSDRTNYEQQQDNIRIVTCKLCSNKTNGWTDDGMFKSMTLCDDCLERIRKETLSIYDYDQRRAYVKRKYKVDIATMDIVETDANDKVVGFRRANLDSSLVTKTQDAIFNGPVPLAFTCDREFSIGCYLCSKTIESELTDGRAMAPSVCGDCWDKINTHAESVSPKDKQAFILTRYNIDVGAIMPVGKLHN